MTSDNLNELVQVKDLSLGVQAILKDLGEYEPVGIVLSLLNVQVEKLSALLDQSR